MKVEEYKDGDVERHTIAAMVTNRDVAAAVARKWTKRGLFASPFLNIAGSWCVEHFRKYKQPIGSDLAGTYADWAETAPDQDTVKLIGELLRHINDEYVGEGREIANTAYVLDRAEKYFELVRTQRLIDGLTKAKAAGDLDKCRSLLNEFGKSVDVMNFGVDMLQDKEALHRAFAEDSVDQLITWPGDLNILFGDLFSREQFVMFMGPTGRGKTFWLCETAWMALLQRRKVLFLSAGDMNQNQMYERFSMRAANKPKWPGTVKYPISLRKEGGEINVEHEDMVFDEKIQESDASEAFDTCMRRIVKSKEPHIKLICYPAGTLSAKMVADTVEYYAQYGWVADVVLIDYSDLMAMPYNTRDVRDKINSLWIELRSLCHSMRILIVTATQANRESMKSDTVTMLHTGEDIRKGAHVSGAISINQNHEERGKRLFRMHKIKDRTGECDIRHRVYTAHCLSVAKPAVLSLFDEGKD